ncbi:hypothetical protein HY991_00145 [Candidatus Micrarchaeota archaeon]|nr:hypothetical protein [Candidatus Micrarchaeota archaeon]
MLYPKSGLSNTSREIWLELEQAVRQLRKMGPASNKPRTWDFSTNTIKKQEMRPPGFSVRTETVYPKGRIEGTVGSPIEPGPSAWKAYSGSFFGGAFFSKERSAEIIPLDHGRTL